MFLSARVIIILGFLLRLIVVFWNGFFEFEFGQVADAGSFHGKAAEWAENPTLDHCDRQREVFPCALSFIYHFTSNTLLFGSFLSCISWVGSAVLLIKIMRLLAIEKPFQSKAMLIYALLPSSIIFTSITLRETYQLLFVNLAVYSALKIWLRKSPLYWLVLFFSITCLGMLHAAFLPFGIFLLITSLLFFFAHGKYKGFSAFKVVISIPFALLIAAQGIPLIENYAYNLGDGLIKGIEAFQSTGLTLDARAFYKESLQIDGIYEFLIFIPTAIFQYLFEPMPWRISSVVDIYVLLENLLRGWLIWKALTALSYMRKQKRRPEQLAFYSYLVIESVWSMGTINWGTAMRHHIPSIGLLIVAAFSGPGRKKAVKLSTPIQAKPYPPSLPTKDPT